MNSINKAADLIIKSERTFVFTGAGISVESGIPPFRGEDGIWNNFDPKILDLNYYINNAQIAWPLIKGLFYNKLQTNQPNLAHKILAEWEDQKLLAGIVTQNIDHLHQEAGSRVVHEFHGTTSSFICPSCHSLYEKNEITISNNPPICNYKNCSNLLKQNFTFFGEDIPKEAYSKSQESTLDTDVYIIIGTSGEVTPANQIPIMAKQNGATIIEINTNQTLYTKEITDVFLKGKATSVLTKLDNKIKSFLTK